jgi:hypothetical protein
MEMLKVLTIGFDKNEIKPHENFIFAVHTPGLPEGMSYTEYIMKCQQMAKEADVVIVKGLIYRKLEEDEVILLYSAYTNSTPIFTVEPLEFEYYAEDYSELPSALSANLFENLEQLYDHLNAYYVPKRIM